ncbi:hypothetical protein GLYMA_19G042950v4 [Glycine max]|nr:hypothetical protein GLYMA_19G042950v4 [Glycine max]KAH1076357.1 hypothetical protein GYH30_052017 [Glycine max]
MMMFFFVVVVVFSEEVNELKGCLCVCFSYVMLF